MGGKFSFIIYHFILIIYHHQLVINQFEKLTMTEMKPLELKGPRGWACYQAYLSVIYYLPATRIYRDSADKMTRFQIQHDFTESTPERKIQIITDLLSICNLNDRDLMRLLMVHKDKNGAHYSEFNADNLSLDDVANMIFQSILACSNASKTLFFYQNQKSELLENIQSTPVKPLSM